MRLALTVASPGARRTADVVLEADPATPVAWVAAELARLAAGDPAASAAPAASAMSAASAPASAASAPAPAPPSAAPAPASADPGGRFAVPLYIAGRLVPPQLTVLESPIRPAFRVIRGFWRHPLGEVAGQQVEAW